VDRWAYRDTPSDSTFFVHRAPKFVSPAIIGVATKPA